MRRVILLMLIFILVGCNLNNNPTSKVEELLGRYQGLDKKITYNYLELSDDVSIDEDVMNGYIDVIKRQYRNMSYEIKDEKIDGDSAVVTVQIEVINYKKVMEEYSNSMVHEEVIEKLSNVNDRINYTIDFIVSRDKDGNWELDNLTNEMEEKLLGIY